MTKSETNFLFSFFLVFISIILLLNSWEFAIFTFLAAISHYIDSKDFKKVIEEFKCARENRKKEDTSQLEGNNKNTKISEINIEKERQDLTQELKKLDYKRSKFSITLKAIATLGIISYVIFLFYVGYSSIL